MELATTDERKELIDRGLRGLVLVKRKNGTPKWCLKYQCPRTLQKRNIPLGSFPDLPLHKARQLGMEIIRQEYGGDPFDLTPSPDIEFHNGEPTAPINFKRLIAQEEHIVVLSKQDANNPNDGSIERLTKSYSVSPKSNVHDFDRSNHHDISPKFGLLTLNRFYTEHYLPYIKAAKRSWQTDVSVFTNHIQPILGGYAMIDIKPFLIQEMVQSLVSKNLSPSTCNRALIILRFMYNCGIRWEVLPKMENPCKNVKELALNNKKERFLNASEISNLKIELAKSRNKFLPYIVQLLILTGCRRGEALNAQIQHFDLGRGDWIVPLPKAGKARHIPLNEMAILTVRASIALKQSQNQRCIESPYLYPNPSTGEPFQQIFYSWDKARKAAHIDEVRMHDLRHSFASAMVNSGMTLYDVKEILGHSNIRNTERYAHLSNSRLRQAAESVTTYYDQQDWLGLP